VFWFGEGVLCILLLMCCVLLLFDKLLLKRCFWKLGFPIGWRFGLL
jgi:hypothetical protein